MAPILDWRYTEGEAIPLIDREVSLRISDTFNLMIELQVERSILMPSNIRFFFFFVGLSTLNGQSETFHFELKNSEWIKSQAILQL